VGGLCPGWRRRPSPPAPLPTSRERGVWRLSRGRTVPGVDGWPSPPAPLPTSRERGVWRLLRILWGLPAAGLATYQGAWADRAGVEDRPSPPAPLPTSRERGVWPLLRILWGLPAAGFAETGVRLPGVRERPRQYVHNIPAARALRRPLTPTEAILWDRLRDRGLEGLKFRRQHAVGRFVLDFYCSELRLAVEVDGAIHNSPEHRTADAARQSELEGSGIRFIRIPASVVEADIDHALELIRRACELNG